MPPIFSTPKHKHPLARFQQQNPFADTSTYPPFLLLPSEHPPSAHNSRLAPHYVFLGEIVRVLTFPRLRLYVKDREGTEVPIAFHDGMSGFEFLKEAKKGHTVMVAQAKGHLFMDLSFGLRAEEKDLERVRFVEVGGKKLNEAGKMLAKEREKDEWKCDGCGEVKDKNVDFALSRCGGCKFVRYCNRKCQAQHWSKEHKEACKALREARWFAEKKWLNMGKENKLTPLQEE